MTPWYRCPEPEEVCGVRVDKFWGAGTAILLNTCRVITPPRRVIVLYAKPYPPVAQYPTVAWKVRVVRRDTCKVVFEKALPYPGPVPYVEVRFVAPEEEGEYKFEVELWEYIFYIWWVCTARGEVTVIVKREIKPPPPPTPPTSEIAIMTIMAMSCMLAGIALASMREHTRTPT